MKKEGPHHKLSPLKWIPLAVIILILCSSCKKSLGIENPDNSSLAVFTEAWRVMDQRYALFNIKGVDWSATFDQYKDRIQGNVPEDSLFNIISEMLETLHDGHVSLISPHKKDTYDRFYTAYPQNFNFDNLRKNYLANSRETGPFIYTSKDSIGYLYYSSFEKEILPDQLDSIFSYFGNTKGLIVDVRNNLGGETQNVELLFKRFLNKRTLVKYEVRKNGPDHNDLSPPEPSYLEGSTSYYSPPVCVLTNRSCFSACNDFVLFMSGLSNVTLVGDQTGGGGGVPAGYLLANGWQLQYTASMTLSPDRSSVENGVAPDVKVNISNLDDHNGSDPILERAFSILQ